MEWTPKSDDELACEALLPDGEYNAEVLEAEEQTSKNGNDMWKLKLKVYGEGMAPHVFDYISPDFMAHKFKHFFESAGEAKLYEGGKATVVDIHGLNVWVVVATKQDKGYAPRNVVVDYVVKNEKAKSAVAEVDEDLPF